MQQYHAEHHDSEIPAPRLDSPPTSHEPDPESRFRRERPGPSLLSRKQELPPFVEPGAQAGDVAELRVLAPRRLRRLDVDGPCPMRLTLNGEPIGVLRPGENTFEPPVPLKPGDMLQLLALAPGAQEGSNTFGGRTAGDESSTMLRASAQGGRHV